MSTAPKDVLNIALRNESIVDLAYRNPEVSQTFVGIVDCLIDFFGNEINKVEVQGPMGTVKPYDFKFVIGGK